MKRSRTIMLMLGVVMTASVHSKTVWQGSAMLVIKPSKLEEFKKAVAKIMEPTRKEAGCIAYDGYQVVDDTGKETNRFEFHEIWESKEAMLVDHKEKSVHMQAFFKEIKAGTPDSFLESFEVKGQTVRLLNSL